MKLKIIEEGLRFGEKERSALRKRLDHVLVGCEYEFHFDEFESSHGVDMDQIFKMTEERGIEYQKTETAKEVPNGYAALSDDRGTSKAHSRGAESFKAVHQLHESRRI